MDNPDFYSLQEAQIGGCIDPSWQPWQQHYWGTLAYVINRHGMRSLLEQMTSPGKWASNADGQVPQLLYLELPLEADSIIYRKATTTYSLSRPLFRTASVGACSSSANTSFIAS